jgi:hypothetical protein
MKRPYAKRFLGSFECLCVCDALSFIEQSCRASACLDLGDRVGSPREHCSQEINNIRFSAMKIHPGYNMAREPSMRAELAKPQPRTLRSDPAIFERKDRTLAA